MKPVAASRQGIQGLVQCFGQFNFCFMMSSVHAQQTQAQQ